MDDLVPSRERVPSHVCLCVTVNSSGNPDKCHRVVNNPDQPICDDCEDLGHHLRQLEVRHS